MEQRIFMLYKNKLMEGSSEKADRTFFKLFILIGIRKYNFAH